MSLKTLRSTTGCSAVSSTKMKIAKASAATIERTRMKSDCSQSSVLLYRGRFGARQVPRVSKNKPPTCRSGTLPLNIGRIVNEQGRHEHGQNTRRQIDVEYPPPGPFIGYPPSDNGPDYWSHYHAHSENGHCHAVFAPGEGFEQNRLGERLQPAASQPLEDPRKDEHVQRRGGAAKNRAGREKSDGEI